MTVPTSGTPATRRPASELVTCCSAQPRSTHGPAISASAKATTHGQRRSVGRRSTRAIASGRSTAAPTVVRANTSTGGDTSATATRISRYGMPQITAMAANTANARRLIRGWPGRRKR